MTTGFGSELRLELFELFLKGQITENKISRSDKNPQKPLKILPLKISVYKVYCSGNVNTNVTASSGE